MRFSVTTAIAFFVAGFACAYIGVQHWSFLWTTLVTFAIVIVVGSAALLFEISRSER